MTSDDKYSLLNCDKLTQPMQMQLSKNEKNFSQFFLHFLNLDTIFNILKKKMTLIAFVFRILQIMKDVVRKMSEESRSTIAFDKNNGKWAQPLLKSARQHIYHISWSLWRKLKWKKPHLVICKIWGLFVNTTTDDNKYSLRNCDNLMQPVQIHLSQKQTIFSPFFFCIFEI